MELLALSVGIGLIVGLLFTELFGFASGGLIVPGYVALAIDRPYDLAVTLIIAFVTYGAVRVLGTFLIIYGKRRIAIMILVGYLLGMLVGIWSGPLGGEFAVIGFIIPGLIAIWMDRQGVGMTLSALAIVSVVVRLTLILFAGQELMP